VSRTGMYVSSIFGEWILSEARLRPRSTLNWGYT